MILDGFKGMYPALVSPRDGAGAFSTSAFEKLMARIYEQGSHGVYVAGNTGEGYLMTMAERKLATEDCRQSIKRTWPSSSTRWCPLRTRCG